MGKQKSEKGKEKRDREREVLSILTSVSPDYLEFKLTIISLQLGDPEPDHPKKPFLKY